MILPLLTGLFLAGVCLIVTASDSSAQSAPLLTALMQAESSRNSSPGNDEQLRSSKALIDRGAYGDAAKMLADYLAQHSASADAHFLLGYVLYRMANAKDSLAQYTLGAKFRTPDANDLAVVAMDYLFLHDYADADKWLSVATSWQPENALYWYYLGRTKYNENHFEEAIESFQKCLTLHPKDLRAEYNLGLSYAGLGRDLDAESAYKLAIEWEQNSDQKDPQPFLDMGMLQLENGHPDQALPYLEAGTAIGALNPKLHEELGRAYEQLNELSKADAELSKATELAPLVSSLHFELARIYQKEGQGAKAKEEFARCAALNATHSSDAAETPNPDPDQSGSAIAHPKTP